MLFFVIIVDCRHFPSHLTVSQPQTGLSELLNQQQSYQVEFEFLCYYEDTIKVDISTLPPSYIYPYLAPGSYQLPKLCYLQFTVIGKKSPDYDVTHNSHNLTQHEQIFFKH